MALKKQFKTDSNLETKGVVIQYGDTRIRIARAGGANVAYKKALETEMKPHRRALAANVMDNDMALPILQSVFAKHVILDWNTQCEIDGEKQWVRGIDPVDVGQLEVPAEDLPEALLEVTPENILKVFAEMPELYNDLQDQATSHAIFREDTNEAIAGNS